MYENKELSRKNYNNEYWKRMNLPARLWEEEKI